MGMEAGKQSKKVFVSCCSRLFFPDLWYCNGSVSESVDFTADSKENVRKNIEIGTILGYTVSMFNVLRVKEWMRRYNIL